MDLETNAQLQFAKTIALHAGAIILSQQGKVTAQQKKDGSIVTTADKESSQYLRQEIVKAYPRYGLLDEEYEGDSRSTSDYSWIIDPLDGTPDYMNNGDNFGVLIGLTHYNIPILGVGYQPRKNRLCYAVQGKGAYIEEENKIMRMSVSPLKPIEEISMLVSRFRANKELDEYLTKINPGKIVGMSTSFKSLEVACGAYDAFISTPNNILNAWDICALDIITQEAGGIITDFKGEKMDYGVMIENKKGIICSSKELHPYLLNKINN